MKVLGVVAEYNPFHNGHLYHLEQSKAVCAADCVVSVMSGNFIQRGEPAIVDKWARAEMAIRCGVDLVIELPVVYAMASAEYFSFGAVKILDSLGCIDYLSFGSEAGNIEQLDVLADILHRQPDAYRKLLKESLDSGISYPAAREEALIAYTSTIKGFHSEISEIIKNSNNILGIEYLKALRKLNSTIMPITIKRTGNSYNSEIISGSMASATSIRKLLQELSYNECLETLMSVLPQHSIDILLREFENGKGPVFQSDFDNIVLSAIRKMSADDIKKLPYVSEGLENRIKSSADDATSIAELIDGVSTRRYTNTRVKRCIFNILTGMTNADFKLFNFHQGPQYIRVLGFNQKGRRILSQINKKSTLPVIVKTADFKNSCNPLLPKMLAFEASSTDQYVLAHTNPKYRRSGSEYTHSIILAT